MNAIDAIGSVSASSNRRVRCCICGFSEVRTDEVVDRALEEAGCALSDIDAVAVTAGPGLIVALLVG